MRIRSLLLAGLLSTTCLSAPERAAAGPVAAFVSGFWTAISTGVVAGAGITGAWAIGTHAAAWITGGSFLSRLVLSVGLSALSSALAPRPTIPPAEVMANYAQDVAWCEWVYGRVRKGGPYALSAYSREDVPYGMVTRPSSARRHYGVILACHSTLGPVTHYLDKWEVDTDADGLVTTDPVNGKCWIRSYTGQSGQAADPVWRAIFPEVGAADDFAGLSYAALYADRPPDDEFAETYPQGREWAYAPVWDGCDTIFDPRSATFGWSDNAALIIADVATRIYGKEVDWAEVATEAAICDATVTNRDGGTQKRWTINTVIRADMTWEAARAHLQLCCDAFFYERSDGKLGFKVGYYSAPTVTLTAGDFLQLSVKHKATGPDEVGSYALRYVEPARDWSQEVTGAVVVNPDPAAPRQEQECYGIDSHNQAWRVTWRWAKTAAPDWQFSGTLKVVGYDCLGQRFLRLVHAELGIDTVVEVGVLARNQGSHTFAIEAVSVAAADFAPDALALEPARPLRAEIAEDGTVPVPAALTGAAVEGTGGIAMIEWSWPAQDSDLRQVLRIRAPAAGLPDWQEVEVPAGQTSYVQTGLIDGASYEAQIRNRTGAGRLSVWAPVAPVVVVAVANTTAPAAMADFAGTVAGSSVELTWTAPNDPVYASARIFRATGSTSFGDASLVAVEFGPPNIADSWTDAAPGVGSHSYWIEPINGSGIPGPRSGPETVTVV